MMEEEWTWCVVSVEGKIRLLDRCRYIYETQITRTIPLMPVMKLPVCCYKQLVLGIFF